MKIAPLFGSPVINRLWLGATLLLPRLYAAELHVSTTGADTNPGTAAMPLATPAHAVEVVRQWVAAGLASDVRVVIHGGTYELAAPLAFTEADSGSDKYSITYASAPGQVAVLSGGRQIRKWTQAAVGQAYEADLPEVKAGHWFFRQLTINDQRATRARWPDTDGVLHLAKVSDDVRGFTFDRPLPGANLQGQRAELVVYENWSVSRALITGSDAQQLTTATPVGWIGHGAMTTASPGKPAFIENLRAGLNQPGEWFLDSGSGRLSCIPPTGQDSATMTAVAPALTQLIKITGTQQAPVRNLRFEGLRFEHTDFALPSFGYSEIQAAHYGTSTKEPTFVQSVAIECTYADACRFDRCRMAHLNNSAIGFGAGCRNNSIINCLIEDIGGTGVMVGWRGTGRLQGGSEGSLDADWADPADAPVGNEVSNCEIRRCGADSRGAVGVFAAFSANTRIAHNLIHDLPYSGVSAGYRWNSTPTSQVRCRLEFNHIHDVMKTLADGGGIYTLGFQPGTVLRGNHIHNVHRSAYAQGGAPNNGFFIDEGSKEFLFEANVVYETSGEPVRFNQTQREWHTWKDNHFNDQATPDVRAQAAKTAGLEAGHEKPGPPSK